MRNNNCTLCTKYRNRLVAMRYLWLAALGIFVVVFALDGNDLAFVMSLLTTAAITWSGLTLNHPLKWRCWRHDR